MRGNIVNSAEITAVIDAQLDIVDPNAKNVAYSQVPCACVGKWIAMDISDIWVRWTKRCKSHREGERVEPVRKDKIREI